tara:strand:+ start:2463 stop:2975 length:513 start_codon:yes stop_codon:yes gene_type:complete
VNRFESVNQVYLPYVEKYLGGKPLQNILVCGGNIGSVETELKRHKQFDYDKMFHFEVVEESIDYEKVIKDDILCPKVPIESVNLIYADVGGTSVEKTTKFKVEEVVQKGLQNNKLKTLVFLFFNGINQEPFLNDNFNVKSKDFFSENINWYDKWNNEYYTQRLDGIVFYE